MTRRSAILPRRRPGTVLIVTLAIILILSGLVLSLARAMRIEALASANRLAALQAAAVERGAEQYLLALVEQDGDYVLSDPEDLFAAVPVGDGFFWVVRPDDGESASIFGLVDEAAKVNLNTAPYEALLLLPDMTEELAGSVIDWRDPDDNTSAGGGAESDYYLSLPQPYTCKNAPFECVEELLYVKDFTTAFLYDPLVAGLIDTDLQSDSGTAAAPGLCLADLLTIYTAENNQTADGEPRVNVNNADRAPLTNALADALGAGRANEIIARLPGRQQVTDIFDFQARTGMTADEFSQVADRLTTSAEPVLRGRINLNTAPRDVLLTLPGIDENDAAAIIAARGGTAADPADPAWIADVLGPKAVGLGNFITTRATQYAADIVAVSGDGRAVVRCRVVIDSRIAPPRIVYRRDISHQGWPLDEQILSSLRKGEGIPNSLGQTGRAF